MRRIPEVLDCVQRVNAAGKLVATICHGPWVLISANIVRGRTLTSTVGIKDDVMNAGATWLNQPVVRDGNIISAQVPKDLPAFGAAMIEWLNSHP
jgi:protease I